MVHILDNDLPSKLLQIEGSGFQWQLDLEGPHSLQFCIQHYQERCLIAESEMSDEDFKWRLDLFAETIYGSGGWNRYFIRGTGEVIISTYHSTDRAIAKAIELGFGMRD
jgi:hypothetical protein